jgi:hypothetical protein
VPDGLNVGGGYGWWVSKGGAVGVPLEVMVATLTIPRVFTEIRSTDGLYLGKIQIRNCVNEVTTSPTRTSSSLCHTAASVPRVCDDVAQEAEDNGGEEHHELANTGAVDDNSFTVADNEDEEDQDDVNEFIALIIPDGNCHLHNLASDKPVNLLDVSHLNTQAFEEHTFLQPTLPEAQLFCQNRRLRRCRTEPYCNGEFDNCHLKVALEELVQWLSDLELIRIVLC